jgi:hypothetical protein
VTASVPASAAAKPKRTVIGRAHFTVPAGTSRKLTFKLNRTGAALLHKRKRMRVTVTVTSRVAGGAPTTTTKTATIKAPPRKRGRR